MLRLAIGILQGENTLMRTHCLTFADPTAEASYHASRIKQRVFGLTFLFFLVSLGCMRTWRITTGTTWVHEDPMVMTFLALPFPWLARMYFNGSYTALQPIVRLLTSLATLVFCAFGYATLYGLLRGNYQNFSESRYFYEGGRYTVLANIGEFVRPFKAASF